jgi:hypothetical protein
MSKKILNHPDKDLIIKKLLEGESLRSVEEWLREKYDDPKFHVTFVTMQKFRKEHLNIEGDYLEDIKEIRRAKDKAEEEQSKKDEVKKNSAYQQKLEEIVDAEIDVTRRLLEMEALVNARLEYYFNILQAGGSVREDKVFIEYVNLLRNIMADWMKFIEGHTDNKVEHNININIVMQQITIIKNVVNEILSEIQPEVVPIFIEKLNQKLDVIDYEQEIKKNEISKIDDFRS